MQHQQNNLLLAKVMAIELRLSTSNPLTGGNDDNDGVDNDYYQLKPADIRLTKTLVSRKTTVGEYLVTVHLRSNQRSATYGRYSTRHITFQLAAEYRHSQDAGAGLSYLANIFSTLFTSFGVHGTPVRYYKSDMNRLQIRKYRSNDNRIVVAIEAKMTEESTIYYVTLRIPIYSESSYSEDILGKIESLDLRGHSNQDQKIALLNTFLSLVHLDREEYRTWKNFPLGGLILQHDLPNFEDYREVAVLYSQWHLDGDTSVSVDKIYETKYSTKCIRIRFPGTLETSDSSVTLEFFVEKPIPGIGNDYSPFLAQINLIVANIKIAWPNDLQPQAYKLHICDRISWRLDLSIPHGSQRRKTSSDVYLFIQNPVMDQSGCFKNPHGYWSLCPSGTTRLNVRQAYSLGIDHLPRLERIVHTAKYVYHPKKDVLKQMYEARGFKAESDEVSKMMGYPLPEHKELRLPKLKRRVTFSDLKTLRRTKYSYAQLNLDPQLFPKSRSSITSWMTKIVPLYIQSYDLRTTGYELQYDDLDIDPTYEEMPREIKAWYKDVDIRALYLLKSAD
ncbi:hypothetical protein M422DRAFT_257562 [Sphaerobolus stellatus SS14]|uniref:Uncharacterized protein n=1 Tax=Sphaerobolus stellatus (strain SS14) TaxID=990650 RepID=A0A0C9UXV1_SPHS4|nr:hypothetical protein M422DRAFT_257562 [Sphaerobolus stellatus SS14]